MARKSRFLSNEKTYSYVINIIKEADIRYDDNYSQMKVVLLFTSMKMGHIIKNSVKISILALLDVFACTNRFMQ